MKALIEPGECGLDLDLTELDGRHWRVSGLSEHGLRDLEWVLARRRAMSKHCAAEAGEHTCSLPPGHEGYADHLCRACTRTWQPGLTRRTP